MGVLPFLYSCRVRERAGTVLITVGGTVWPATRQSASSGGERHDHTGELPGKAWPHVDAANRVLDVLDGPHAGSYLITGAAFNPMVDHVGLELRRMTNA